MKIFLSFCLTMILTSSAWADSICRQSEIADFGSLAVSLPSNSFVITQDCAESRLVAKKPVSLSANFSPDRASRVTHITGSTPFNVNVYFGLNRVNLDESDRRLMNQFPAGIKVNVTGYTCSIGNEDYNDKLSLRRAEGVALYLRGRGVTVNAVDGKGECCPQSTTDLSKNRRVLIKEEK